MIKGAYMNWLGRGLSSPRIYSKVGEVKNEEQRTGNGMIDSAG